MKVHSVQFKFFSIVISAIMAITIFVGGLSIYEVDKYIQKETKNLINITCSNEAAQVNDIFGDIEKSVRIMESYVLSLFEKATDIEDRDAQAEIIQIAGEMFADVAVNTDGAVAYYLRITPEISDSKTGMFYTKVNEEEGYVRLETTDLALYEKDDVEHVGWFWQPYEAGKPIWMAPYHNQNNDILMISYVIPLYCENQFFGVVGMDFDYVVLSEEVNQIKIYENGFAHLELDGVIIQESNESHNSGHSYATSEEYLQVSADLTNGMTLVLSASYNDIRQIRYQIACKIILIALLLVFVFSLIVFAVVKKIMKPLKKLTAASIKLSSGDYDVEIAQSDTYEIQQLSLAFENMIINLREHKKLQYLLAYRDPLTGLRNATSYKEWVIDFNKKIQEQNIDFGIVMLDLNYLKETNDIHGHSTGNELIVNASQIISDTFKRSPVFRIGGDEFVVILQNKDFEERDALFERLESECANTYIESNGIKLPISIAKGFSRFDTTTDTQFSDVFNRADSEMYKNKKIMKEAAV